MTDQTTHQQESDAAISATWDKAADGSYTATVCVSGLASEEQAKVDVRRMREALSAPEQQALPEKSWRCFHCDSLFTDPAAARDHFGVTEFDKPVCQIDATHLRWLEAQHRRNVDEDTEALRTVRSLASEHETLRQRAEELGYARGLADAKRHPHELGLVAAEDDRQTQQRVEDLTAIAKQGARHIDHEDILAIAAIPESELRRRYLRQMDWHRHFAHSLDGIEAIRFMPGSAPDGCWSHREVRSVVLRLVELTATPSPGAEGTIKDRLIVGGQQ